MKHNNYFVPSPVTKKVMETFNEMGTAERIKLQARLNIIEEKGFKEGLKARWIKKKSVVCILKKPSIDGFLLFKGACIKGHPAEWELVEE